MTPFDPFIFDLGRKVDQALDGDFEADTQAARWLEGRLAAAGAAAAPAAAVAATAGGLADAFAFADCAGADEASVFDLAGDRAFVEQLYVNSFLREGDAAGISWWTARLEAGADRADVFAAFVTSEEATAFASPVNDADDWLGLA